MATLTHTTPFGVNELTLPALLERERLRTRIEAAVVRLLDALDALDDDPDLEDAYDAETVNEDGGDINDGPQDEDELDGPDDNGIADEGGRAEQIGGLLGWSVGGYVA